MRQDFQDKMNFAPKGLAEGKQMMKTTDTVKDAVTEKYAREKDQGLVWIVEDDLDVLEIAEAYFQQKGFKARTFEDPIDALKAFKQEDVKPDVVILDMMLPHKSGLETIQEMKAIDPQLPLILMTAHQSVELAVQAIESGAYDFVVKPLHFPQLLISVQRALHLRKLQNENQDLRHVVENQKGISSQGIVARSPVMKQLLEVVQRIAHHTTTVLIQGESGSGKEVIARTLHELSPRSGKPFVAINCSAIPENLLESELFGFAKGSFTGAQEKRIGLFEEANEGTLFLDEIGDLSLPLQAKLLRVLQERKIKRIGENQFRNVDVRVITATHKNLKTEVQEKKFREDLFFRLNVITLHIPALRERKDDILPLAEFFLKKFCLRSQMPLKKFTRDAIQHLLNQFWKGNVRELENCIERAVVMSMDNAVSVDDLLPIHFNSQLTEASGFESSKIDFTSIMQDWNQLPSLDVMNEAYIHYVLARNQGAKDVTAKTLGIDRKTLYRKLKSTEQSESSGDQSEHSADRHQDTNNFDRENEDRTHGVSTPMANM